MWKGITWSLAVLAFALLVVAAFDAHATRALLRDGVRATGTVVAAEPVTAWLGSSRHGSAVTFHSVLATIAFHDASGRRREFTQDVPESGPKLGDSVETVHPAGDPGGARALVGISPWGASAGLAFLAAMAGVASFAVYVLGRFRPVRMSPRNRNGRPGVSPSGRVESSRDRAG